MPFTAAGGSVILKIGGAGKDWRIINKISKMIFSFKTVVPIIALAMALAQVRVHAAPDLLQEARVVDGAQVGALLKTALPIVQTKNAQWNTVPFQFPSGVDYSPQTCVSGAGSLASADRPDYLGLSIRMRSGKTAFATVALGEGPDFSFSLTLARFTPNTQGAQSGRAADGSDVIEQVDVYARFAKAAESTLSIQQFAITSPTDIGACETTQTVNQRLLQGDFKIQDGWLGVHPRLYASASELKQLAVLYKREPQYFTQALPTKWHLSGKTTPLDVAQSAQGSAMAIARIAIAYRLTGDPIYLARLQEWVPVLNAYRPSPMDNIGSAMGLTAGHILLGLALAYDVLHGSVDVETQAALRGVLVRQGAQTFSDISRLPNFPYEQNHLIIPVAGLAVAAMALCDEGEQYQRWGAFASNIMARSLRSIAHDGWFFEGLSYWDYTMQFPAAYAAAAQRLIGGNLFLNSPFKGLPQYVAHMTLPNPDFVFDFADWGPRVEADGIGFQRGFDMPWHTVPSRVKPFVLYLTWKEGGQHPLLARHLRRTTPGGQYNYPLSNIDASFWMLLGMGAAIPALPVQNIDTSPPYHYFSDMDVVHWRSNWNDPEATAIAFKSGPPAGHQFVEHLKRHPDSKPSLGHAHPDAGSFLLYSRGAFLANDTGYTGNKETAHHNSLLVDGVGQGLGGTPWATFTDKPYSSYDPVRMENVWLDPKVVASTAIFQDAYRSTLKLKKVARHLIMVDGRFLVISDELESSQPHVYAWRLHTDQAPVLRAANIYAMTNGKARITIIPLVGATHATIAPTIVETELFNPKRRRPQQRGFHLELRSAHVAKHRFLTALVVGSSGTSDNDVSAREEADGTITLADANGTCRIWIGAGSSLQGHFAYELRNRDGAVRAVGVYGTVLRTGEISIDNPSGEPVNVERVSSGDWGAATSSNGASRISSIQDRAFTVTTPGGTRRVLHLKNDVNP